MYMSLVVFSGHVSPISIPRPQYVVMHWGTVSLSAMPIPHPADSFIMLDRLNVSPASKAHLKLENSSVPGHHRLWLREVFF